ncbi:hypothetical protein [Streptomyces sp. TLI_171]|uniref:hypothetical protein n=1 Tax=Streptomyces sp. TLI_171 TaxID=1938859 RepID=UPI000C195C00|nr:hypothetical protein [Streptomyces sp. TLI_171]RKE20219.1 hypothetical protein BX266_3570 [Streptomyces sp. TLI_171]
METERRTPALQAGRRTAGAALLGWLDDPRAPRLCRVTGSAGSGKSHLLAWLLALGTAPDAPPGHRVHAALPAEGLDVRGALWLLGSQLGYVARTPEELCAALDEDGRRTVICVPELDRAADPTRLAAELLDPLLALPHFRLVVVGAPEASFTSVAEPAVLDLDDPRWTDRERFDAWCARAGHDPAGYPSPGRALGRPAPQPPTAAELLARVPRTADGALDLPAAGEEVLTGLWIAAARAGDLGPLAADPLLHVLARPAAVTAALTGREDPVAAAWDAAGPALIDLPDAPGRAHTLRARLLGTAPEAAARLATLPAPWSARWARWEPGTALGTIQGEHWLVVDRNGTVRRHSAANGAVVGLVPVAEPRPLQALTVTAGGTLVLLDTWGGTELLAPTRPAPGLEPYALDEALARLRAAASAPTAVAAAADLPAAAPALGDAAGAVHWYQDGQVRSAELHTGPVTALAALALGPEDVPLLAGGGYDGTVRLWGPDGEPMTEPADRRPAPVTAVALASGADGLLLAAAWSDGLIRVRRPELPGRPLDLRLGSPARALDFHGETLLIALDDGLLAADLRRLGD